MSDILGHEEPIVQVLAGALHAVFMLAGILAVGALIVVFFVPQQEHLGQEE